MSNERLNNAVLHASFDDLIVALAKRGAKSRRLSNDRVKVWLVEKDHSPKLAKTKPHRQLQGVKHLV